MPVIATAAKAAAGSQKDCLAAGMDGCISKPIERAELENVIRQWLPVGKEGPAPCPGTSASGHTTPACVINNELLSRRFSEHRLKELLVLFKDTAPGDVEQIGQSLALHAYSDAKDMAHTFKGSCATVTAEALVQICVQLEQSANKADAIQCDTLIAELKNQLDATLDMISERLNVMK